MDLRFIERFRLQTLDGGLLLARRVFAALTLATLVIGCWPSSGMRSQRLNHAPLPAEESVPRPLQSVLNVLQQKTIFNGGSLAPMQEVREHSSAPRHAAAVAAAPKPPLAQLASDYQVVGILNGGTEAALSNAKTQETIYATVGQKIGDMTVKSIQTTGVTLSSEGETVDLSL